jgi:hypothetical protein
MVAHRAGMRHRPSPELLHRPAFPAVQRCVFLASILYRDLITRSAQGQRDPDPVREIAYVRVIKIAAGNGDVRRWIVP